MGLHPGIERTRIKDGKCQRLFGIEGRVYGVLPWQDFDPINDADWAEVDDALAERCAPHGWNLVWWYDIDRDRWDCEVADCPVVLPRRDKTIARSIHPNRRRAGCECLIHLLLASGELSEAQIEEVAG